MTQPRRTLVSVNETPYYHVVSRCVRRTYLCGKDHTSGRNYEHRRHWIEARIHLLSSIFAIDIYAYAVMSNHYHIVVKLCPEEVDKWTDHEVVERWLSLFKGPLLIQQWTKDLPLCEAQQQLVDQTITLFRKRLTDLSWFMKCLNEPIARQANKEDECTGHFWESRFKSQALLTEEALLSCMAYVDLNPIRADMAKTPETSEHTSIKHRIKPTLDLANAVREQQANQELRRFPLPIKPLARFEGNVREGSQRGILFSLEDYLNLVDTTGRIIRQDKRGAIPLHFPAILERLTIEPTTWLNNATQFEALYNQKFYKKRREAA